MFVLFAFDPIAPRGGWYDYVGVYDSVADALKIAECCDGDWQIVESAKRSIVANGKGKR